MTQPIDQNVDRLAALSEYRKFIVSLLQPEEAEENELCLVLVAFERTLQRRIENRVAVKAALQC
jgi:hypothetical protein